MQLLSPWCRICCTACAAGSRQRHGRATSLNLSLLQAVQSPTHLHSSLITCCTYTSYVLTAPITPQLALVVLTILNVSWVSGLSGKCTSHLPSMLKKRGSMATQLLLKARAASKAAPPCKNMPELRCYTSIFISSLQTPIHRCSSVPNVVSTCGTQQSNDLSIVPTIGSNTVAVLTHFEARPCQPLCHMIAPLPGSA